MRGMRVCFADDASGGLCKLALRVPFGAAVLPTRTIGSTLRNMHLPKTHGTNFPLWPDHGLLNIVSNLRTRTLPNRAQLRTVSQDPDARRCWYFLVPCHPRALLVFAGAQPGKIDFCDWTCPEPGCEKETVRFGCSRGPTNVGGDGETLSWRRWDFSGLWRANRDTGSVLIV